MNITTVIAWQPKQFPFRNASPLYLQSTKIHLLSMAVIHSVAIVNWLLYKSVEAFISANDIQSQIHVSLRRLHQRRFYGHTTHTTTSATLHPCSHKQHFATVNCLPKTTRRQSKARAPRIKVVRQKEKPLLLLCYRHRAVASHSSRCQWISTKCFLRISIYNKIFSPQLLFFHF